MGHVKEVSKPELP